MKYIWSEKSLLFLDSPATSKGVNLNLQDFESDNNLDPFSNCELNTIDDKKILLDVFKTTALTSNTTTSTSSSNSKFIFSFLNMCILLSNTNLIADEVAYKELKRQLFHDV